MSKIMCIMLAYLMAMLTLILIVILFLWATPAKAGREEPVQTDHEMTCGDHARIVRQLTEGYGEVRIWLGIVKDKTNVLEMLVSPKGTWTLLITYAKGNPGTRTCLVAEGLTWQTFAVPLPATPPGAKL